MFTGCPVVIRTMSLHPLGRAISNHCYSRQSHQLATHGREGVRFLSHSKPPPRGGPPAGGSLARTWERSSFAPKAAFDSATWTRASTSRLRRLAWTWTQPASAVRRCREGPRPSAAPRPHVRLGRAAMRAQHVAHRTFRVTCSQPSHWPRVDATPGSPHAAGQALPVRHRRKTAGRSMQIYIVARAVFPPVESI